MGMMIERKKKLLMMQSFNLLPKAYRQIEYLESTGTQYFWTDVNVQDGLTVESIQTFGQGSDSYLFGGAANQQNERSCFNGCYKNKLQGAYPINYYNSETTLEYDTIYRIKTTHINGSVTAYVNGSPWWSLTRTGTVPETGAKCVCFGARASDGNVLSGRYLYIGKVYTIKVTKGNILLADYIPCIRISDSKPGMYDTVSKTFYTNAGTGEFLIPTSPKITNYGYKLPAGNSLTNPLVADSEGCVTDYYYYPPQDYTQTMTAYGTHANINIFLDNTYKDYWGWDAKTNENTRTVINKNSNKIRFGLYTSMIDDAYAFLVETGQILFAGKNTQYYGHQNISELS